MIDDSLCLCALLLSTCYVLSQLQEILFDFEIAQDFLGAQFDRLYVEFIHISVDQLSVTETM